jgi:hypothetical protein
MDMELLLDRDEDSDDLAIAWAATRFWEVPRG